MKKKVKKKMKKLKNQKKVERRVGKAQINMLTGGIIMMPTRKKKLLTALQMQSKIVMCIKI